MKLLLDTLLKILMQQGMVSSNECVRQVALWISLGSYASEFAKNPALVTACTVEAIGSLLVLMASRFHSHNVSELPTTPFAIFASSTGDGPALVTTAETVESMSALAASLGVAMPSLGASDGAAGGPFVNLILQQLLAYIVANLPELLERLLNQTQDDE